MSELGQLLRKARLDKGITLDDLQETTKIRKRYLEAIEEGNYKVLPGSFYVRAFIKSYAEAVGHNPNELLYTYRNEIPASNPDSTSDPITPKRSAMKRSDNWSRWATGFMLFSFVLLIIGLIYFFSIKNYNGNDGRTGSDDPNQHLTGKIATDTPVPSATDEAKQEVKAVQPSATPAASEVKFIATERGIDYYQVKNAAKIKVQMSLISDDCWFQIDKLNPSGDTVSHEMIEQGSLAKAGSPKTWELDRSVYLNLGRPNVVELNVNGTVISLGDLPNPKRLQFDLKP